MHQYVLGSAELCKIGSGILENTKLNMTQQCAPVARKANGLLDCVRRIVARSVEGGDPSSRSVLVRPPIPVLGPILGSPVQETREIAKKACGDDEQLE